MKITVANGTGDDKEAEVYQKMSNGRDYPPGLSVYTTDRHAYKQRSLLFLNEDNGRDMTINASASGASQLINNGTDTAAWVGSSITGTKVTFNSIDTGIGWPPAGTKSVLVDNAATNDEWNFAKGGSQALTAYDAITGKVYIDKDWGVGDSVSIYGWDGALVGNEVLLESYISESVFDVAQSFSIPLVDMGLVGASITDVRMSIVSKVGKGPKFYLDEMYFAESATLIYTAAPAKGKVVEFQRIEMNLANNVTSLSYDSFLGLSLTTGFTLQRFEAQVPQVSIRYLDISDMLDLTWEIADTFDDGVNTFLKLRVDLPVPSILEGNRGDRIEITLSDDFSSMLLMNAIVIGKEYING